MSKPRLLDLFCGAGGAAMGYSRAGFEVIGVDIKPQPRYPFEFHQADALEYVAEHGGEFDAIHASPPCQKFTTLQNVNKTRGVINTHLDLIPATRAALEATGKPYIIENVQGSPLELQAIVCGSAVGLKHLARHRHFESNVLLMGTTCTHRSSERIVGVYGMYPDGRPVMRRKEYRTTFAASSIDEAREVMGIDWMTWNEIKQAVPPAYTEYLGSQLMRYVQEGLA